MNRVIHGARPERPPSGFTDELWQMLVASWVEERAGKPQRRLPIPAMLDRLKESIEQWEKSIVPLTPNQCKGKSGYRVYLSECHCLLMVLRQSQVLTAVSYLMQSLVVSDLNGTVDLQFLVNGPGDVPFPHFHTSHVGKEKTIPRRRSLPKITSIFKELLRRGQDVQET